MGKAQRVGSRYNEDVDDVDDEDDQDQQHDQDQGGSAEDDQHGSEEDSEQDAEKDDDQETRPSKREAKYRRQRNEARAELRRVKEGRQDVDRRVQEELAFVKTAAAEGVTDVEAAWKLADREMLQWEQEGDDNPPQLTGVEEAVAKVLDRYPYVASGQEDRSRRDDDDRVRPPHATTSGRATNGPKAKAKELDRAYLERKFPALQKRGSHRGFWG